MIAKFLPTALALATLAGLGFYVYKNETEPLADKSVPKVALTDKATIAKIELEETAKKTTVVLEKGKDDKWEITAPLKAKTDEEKIDSLLTRLEKVKADRLVDGEDPAQKPDLAKYGLDSPTHKVTWTAGGQARTALIGKESPLGSNAYVKLAAEDKVFLVNSGDLEILKKDLFAFRDKTILKAEKEQVKELTVRKAGGESWKFTHGTDGNWTIEEPFKSPGDAQVIGDMVADLGRLKAEEFTAETTASLKPYGLDAPEFTVKLVLKDDGATKTILFGKRKESDSSRVYTKREAEPIVYLADAQLIKALANKPEEFRDKAIFRTGDREIASLTIEKPGDKATANRGKDGKWSYAQSRVLTDPGVAGTQLLDKLKELKAARFITGADAKPSEFGLEKPEYTVRLSLAGKPATTAAKAVEETVLTAVLGKPVESGRYVRLEGESTVAVTKEDLASQLDGFLKTYRELLTFEDWNLKAVALTRKDRKESFEINDKGDWIKAGQKEAVSPLKDKIRNFASTLPHLAPLEWLEESAERLKEFGLAEGATEVVVKTKDAKPDVKLRISTSGGKSYIKLDGKSGIGVIAPDPMNRADELLLEAASPSKPAPAPVVVPTPATPAKDKTSDAGAPAKDAAPVSSIAPPAEAAKAPAGLPSLPALPGLTNDPAKPAEKAPDVAAEKPVEKAAEAKPESSASGSKPEAKAAKKPEAKKAAKAKAPAQSSKAASPARSAPPPKKAGS